MQSRLPFLLVFSLVWLSLACSPVSDCETAEACYQAGVAYAQALEKPVSPYELWTAHRLMRQAAELGHRGAQMALVSQYDEGPIVFSRYTWAGKHIREWLKDADEADRWRKRVLTGLETDAEHGDVHALLGMHTLYEGRIRVVGLSEAIEPDTAKANEALRRAVATGHSHALLRMGYTLERSGEKEVALKYFKQAAEQHDYTGYVKWAMSYMEPGAEDLAQYYAVLTEALTKRVPGAAWDAQQRIVQIQAWEDEGNSLAALHQPHLEANRWVEHLASIDMTTEQPPDRTLFF